MPAAARNVPLAISTIRIRGREPRHEHDAAIGLDVAQRVSGIRAEPLREDDEPVVLGLEDLGVRSGLVRVHLPARQLVPERAVVLLSAGDHHAAGRRGPRSASPAERM